MTPKILGWSQLNPRLSSYKQVDAVHNFERTPLVPLGYKVQTHENPHQQRTYTHHSVDVYYLTSAINHFRFYTCYNIDTGGDTTPDTIAFSPAFMKMTDFISRDMAMHDATDLEKALKMPWKCLENAFPRIPILSRGLPTKINKWIG